MACFTHCRELKRSRGERHPMRSIYRVLQALATILRHNVVIALGINPVRIANINRSDFKEIGKTSELKIR